MSDIFNEYAKKAIEQGLIKEASEVSDETNQRFDSLSDDDIRSLYDVKPNGEEKHILDQAHPESVYVAPAYDKMNGLVENLFERQDIMAWVATKPNDGKHTQKRYVKASQDLTMALLNTAFLFDRTGDTELMKLADSCADRLTKQAIAPLVAAGLAAGVLAVIGIVNNFGGMVDHGVYVNADRAIAYLNKVVKDRKLPGKEEDIHSLIEDILYVRKINSELQSFNIDISNEAAVDSEIAEGKALLGKYIEGVQKVSKRISSLTAIARAQRDAGGGSTWLTRWFGEYGVLAEKGWYLLAGDDIAKALDALETLNESLVSSTTSMRELFSAIKAKAKAGDHKSIEELLEVKEGEKEKEEAAGSGMKQKKEEKEPALSKFTPVLSEEDPFTKQKDEDEE